MENTRACRSMMHELPTNNHLLAVQQEPKKKKDTKNTGEISGEKVRRMDH